MKKQLISIMIIAVFLGLSVQGIVINEALAKTTSTTEEHHHIISDFLFDIYIRVLMRLAHKPSIVTCIIHDDEVIWSHAYGY